VSRPSGSSVQIASRFITGAGAGIGASIARMTAEQGGHAIVTDVDTTAGSAVAAQANGLFLELDAADPRAWTDAATAVREGGHALTSVALNAGKGTGPQPVDILAISDEQYERAVAINCGGVVYGLRHLVPLLEDAGGGVVLVTASVRGLWPTPLDPIYGMTKHAVVGLVRSVAPQLAGRGIRINAMCPGPTLTPATESLLDVPRYRDVPWQTADDAARAALHIMADDSTGQIYSVIRGQVEPCQLPDELY
jgi:NAD(P)-dependent dehydrogenase (short-subunit alcohol dehydrogenase family)